MPVQRQPAVNNLSSQSPRTVNLLDRCGAKGIMATKPKAKINKLNESITLNVEIADEFIFRTIIAAFLFRLGAWILGCGIKFDKTP
jgi:hypothetical protein